jgi:hypothetical protein
MNLADTIRRCLQILFQLEKRVVKSVSLTTIYLKMPPTLVGGSFTFYTLEDLEVIIQNKELIIKINNNIQEHTRTSILHVQ